MSDSLVLSVELGARRVRAALTTRSSTVLERHQCSPCDARRSLTAWIGGIHEAYGADVVVVGRRCSRWTASLIEAVEQAGGVVQLLDSTLLATALRQERQLRDAVWSRRLSLQSALWDALHASGGELYSLPWVVRGWARDQHQWAVHCLDAEDFDMVCSGEGVPF